MPVPVPVMIAPPPVELTEPPVMERPTVPVPVIEMLPAAVVSLAPLINTPLPEPLGRVPLSVIDPVPVVIRLAPLLRSIPSLVVPVMLMLPLPAFRVLLMETFPPSS